MMTMIMEKLRRFFNNRWLIFVAAMWIESCSGVGYMFGSISPLIKTSMGYNQREVGLLSLAKNFGDCIGYFAGFLSEFMPFWCILSIGALHNFVGYGLLWLTVTKKLPSMPLWTLCIAIFVGNNGETYYNTAALVSCVQNFPTSRGQVVGILKGFSGLSGAILGQAYHMFISTNQDSLILMIAVMPPLVIISLMFIIRSVNGQQQSRPCDGLCFTFVYGVCLFLAVYLISFLFLEDLVGLTQTVITKFSIIFFVTLLLPLIVPITLTFNQRSNVCPVEESLLANNEPESGEEIGVWMKRLKRGPRIGENFSLQQALANTDFWLIFVSIVLAAGSGVTIIDHLGQICQSTGHSDTQIFVSLISIWNFLGRVGGGYLSELIVKKYKYPRMVGMAGVQVMMAIGFMYYAMGGPASIYTLTVLIGFGYGAIWGISLPAVSELFGLKSFGALYNFMTMAMPIGSLLFSSLLASNIYEYYAEQQAKLGLLNVVACTGSVCYSITCLILFGVVLVAASLSMAVVHRTTSVYVNLYNNSSSYN